MIGRVIFLAGLALTTATVPLAQAQQEKKVPRIGYLGAASPRLEAFRQGLSELGYVDGKSIIINYRRAGGIVDSLPALAAEMVRLNVDVIVTGGPTDTRAAKEATNTIPIVMALDTDPVGNGFVASLARPGGNITGMSTLAAEIGGKQLEFLKEVIPRLSRVAVLTNPANPGHSIVLKNIQAAAQRSGVTILSLEARTPLEVENAYSVMAQKKAEAVIVSRDLFFNQHVRELAALATKHRMPSIHGVAVYVETGGLMSYGSSVNDNFRRAATFVDKILKGAKPADLPVEQPTKFELVINLKTAKALGVKIPNSILLRADRVIQ